jgi:hypothetical protein
VLTCTLSLIVKGLFLLPGLSRAGF